VNTVNLLRNESTEKKIVYSMRGDRKWRKNRKCLSKRKEEKSELICDIAVYYLFYHGYCEDQRKAAFIILQQTHGYWKYDAHHYILRE
jgi:hypothetical protein